MTLFSALKCVWREVTPSINAFKFIRRSSHKGIHVRDHAQNVSQYVEFESVETVIFK